MNELSSELEEAATQLLAADAKSRGTTLYREGILDQRRKGLIRKREVSLEGLSEKRRRRREDASW